jgi:hypothetical protein
MKQDKIQSPCVNICKLDSTKTFCVGCFRTIGEITNWIFYSDEQRTKIINEIQTRKKEFEKNNLLNYFKNNS